MNNKNWQSDNLCIITGRIKDRQILDPLEGQEEGDICLLVETTLLSGKKTTIPCVLSRKDLPYVFGQLNIGVWCHVHGVLTGSEDSKSGRLVRWVELTSARQLRDKKRLRYENRVLLSGTMEEGGCLFDHGKPIAADFLLRTKNPCFDEPLEVDAFVPEKAVRQFIACVGNGAIHANGALEFLLPEESGECELGCLFHVHQMELLGGEKK